MSADLTQACGKGLVSREKAAARAPEERQAGEGGGRVARKAVWSVAILLVFFVAAPFTARAQQLLGSINGTVTDTSGAVVPGATVKVVNTGTNLTLTETTEKNGSYNVLNLPIGTYTVTVSKKGFKQVVHSEVLVEANRASTVNTALEPGAITAQVTVTATPLLDQTDTTNGYVLGSKLIESTPLGTGSFTQLATMAPGVSADLLSGSGTNAGLGNQDIWANGQRDTSNSVSFNGISGNNVFNGMTSSSVGASRFVLNTNEQFLPGGQIQNEYIGVRRDRAGDADAAAGNDRRDARDDVNVRRVAGRQQRRAHRSSHQIRHEQLSRAGVRVSPERPDGMRTRFS